MSNIQWTDKVWNPVTGCDAVSPGCDNCYAKTMANRLHAMGVEKYRNNFEVTTHLDTIDLPRKWKKPRRVFVNSMSDLFHDDIPFEFLQRIFDVMNYCEQHTFQILTKRSKKLKRIHHKLNWTENIWMGVTVESKEYRYRIEDLINTNAQVKFISFEPLLGQIDIDYCAPEHDELRMVEWLNWAIIGCESGHNRRECKLDWVYSLVDQCQNAQVPVFVKQLDIDGKVVHDIDEFPKDLQFREFPK